MSNFPEMEYKSMEQVIELPENGTSLNLAQQVYRNPSLPVLTRTRAAIAALPFEHPRLAVVATVNAGDFADQLEKAVERSRKIEAKPMTNVSSANVPSDTPSGTKTFSNGKAMIIDRRYRRW